MTTKNNNRNMSKIKKIDEMAVLKTRIHTKRKAAKYVLTDMWIQDDPSTDGYYPHIKNRVGDDLKKLVKKVLEEDFRVDFYEDGLAYMVYPDNEIWLTYTYRDVTYQLKIDIVVEMTEREMQRNGIKSDMV